MKVTEELLKNREALAAAYGWPTAKWIQFCRTLMAEGYKVSLYEAQYTVSKYITVRKGKRTFKVRFSNHKPIPAREAAGDCDFFVGVTNLGVTNTEQALAAVRQHFLPAPQEA